MIGPSFVEILVILVVALVVLGPGRLPTIARSIGRGLREMRKIQQEVRGVWADVDGAPTGSDRWAAESPRSSSSGESGQNGSDEGHAEGAAAEELSPRAAPSDEGHAEGAAAEEPSPRAAPSDDVEPGPEGRSGS